MKHELSDIDPQKMDSQKWDLLLDLLEHPEKYSETQKDELLGDEEVNELYQQLVETRQSLDFAKSKEGMKMPSIDAEWEKLNDEMKLKETQQKEEMSQNAETQQTAKLFPLWSPMRKVAAVAAVLVVSGITFAAIHLVTRSHQPSDNSNTELVSSRKDSIQQVSAPQKSNIEDKADSASLAQLPLVLASLQTAARSTSLLMEHGNTTYLEVLTARQTLLNAQLAQTANRFSEIQSLINLYKALGGGQE